MQLHPTSIQNPTNLQNPQVTCPQKCPSENLASTQIRTGIDIVKGICDAKETFEELVCVDVLGLRPHSVFVRYYVAFRIHGFHGCCCCARLGFLTNTQVPKLETNERMTNNVRLVNKKANTIISVIPKTLPRSR